MWVFSILRALRSFKRYSFLLGGRWVPGVWPRGPQSGGTVPVWLQTCGGLGSCLRSLWKAPQCQFTPLEGAVSRGARDPGRRGNAARHHWRQWRAALGNTLEEESVQPAGSGGHGEVLGERPWIVRHCSLFLQDGVLSCIVSDSPGSRVGIRDPGAEPPHSTVPCFPRFAGHLSGWFRRVRPVGLWSRGEPNPTHGALGTEESSVWKSMFLSPQRTRALVGFRRKSMST